MPVKNNSIKDKIKKGDSAARTFVNSFAHNEEEESAKTTENTNNNDNIDVNDSMNNKNNNTIKNDSVDDSNDITDSNIKIDNKTDSDNNIKSTIESILESESPKKEFVGIYLDSDVHRALNKLCHKSKKKGIKSKIVNDILRNVLKEQGIL